MTYRIQVIDSNGDKLNEVDVCSHNYVEMDFCALGRPVIDSNGDEILQKWCFQPLVVNKEGQRLV